MVLSPRNILLLKFIAAALLYALLVQVGLWLYLQPQGISLYWPAHGMLIALLLLTPRRHWVLLLAVAIALGLWVVTQNTARDWRLSLALRAVDCGEAAICAALMRRWMGDRICFDRVRQVWAFSFVALPVTAVAGGALAAWVGWLMAYVEDFSAYWIIWTNNKLVGGLVVAPALVCCYHAWNEQRRLDQWRYLEGAALLALLMILTGWVFGVLKPLYHPNLAFFYFLLPVLIWIAMRLGPAGAGVATILFTTVAVIISRDGRWPFSAISDGVYGSAVWLQVFLIVSAITAMLVATADAERRHATLALSESERQRERSETMMMVMRATIALDGKWLKVPPQLSSLLGYSEDELKSKTFQEITHPDDVESSTQAAAGLLAGQIATFEGEKRYLRRDGEVVWMYINASLVRSRDGEPLHLLTYLRDVTDEKRREEEFQLYQQRMQQAQKLESLGLMAGGIAHDFNNLLTTIMGHAHLALQERENEPQRHQDLEQIVAATERATELCKQLLAYSGKGAFVIRPVEVPALVAEMAALLKINVPPHIALRLNLAEDTPTIRADVTQLRQVILNLVINAAEAIGEREGRIVIATRLRKVGPHYLSSVAGSDFALAPGDYLSLEVVDTGQGMDESVRRRIFDPFFTTKFTGRGLGLAAVLGIVRGHKGSIEVESLPDQGTTFRLLFPIFTSDPDATGGGRRESKMQQQMTT